MWSTLSLVLLLSLPLTATPAWSQVNAPQLIVPGVGIGPAKLGMPQGLARKVLAAAGLARDSCTVDVLTDHGRVIALGTAFGGCIALPLPARVAQFTFPNGGLVLPKIIGIGGNPDPLSQAFGAMARFVIDPTKAILLWPNGLVVRTSISEDDEVVTYIAVVPPHTRVPPHPFLTPAYEGIPPLKIVVYFRPGSWLVGQITGGIQHVAKEIIGCLCGGSHSLGHRIS